MSTCSVLWVVGMLICIINGKEIETCLKHVFFTRLELQLGTEVAQGASATPGRCNL